MRSDRLLHILMSILSVLSFSHALAADKALATDFADDLRGKVIVGYQGWFGCPLDDGINKSWDHWSWCTHPGHPHGCRCFQNPKSTNLIVDLLPETDEYDQADLTPTDMTRLDGSRVFLFSSLSPGVVKTHFRWMQQYGIDGAAIQRFVVDVSNPIDRLRRDRVLINVRSAAESCHRVFFVTYDVSGAAENAVYEDLDKDWRHIVKDLKITSSPNYLRYRGKPVLQIWGFGFVDRPGRPDQVSRLLSKLKSGSKDLPPVTLIGGVPTCWRLLIGDSKRDSAWAGVYRMYDVISPWLVNRFSNELGLSFFVSFFVKPDIKETRRLGIDYMPVIFPGFSWYNYNHCLNHPDKAILNGVPRGSGTFYWSQIRKLLKANAKMLYAAMFDEVNEGTAIFKVVTKSNRIPIDTPIVHPKLDGCQIRPDHFLKLTGLASHYLKLGVSPPRKMPELDKLGTAGT